MSSTDVYVLNIFGTETPRADLVAAYCPAEAETEIAWFNQHLAPFGV